MAGRSKLFWAGVIGASLCGMCTLGTLGLGALGLVASEGGDSSGTGGSETVAAQGSGKIPFGNTPGRFPGMPGWLPSGRGVPIPDAALDDGVPRGMWWAPRMNGAATSGRVLAFFADGRYADGPRPGGPFLINLEGQAAENGYTGVGTFAVSGDAITLNHDGFSSPDPFSTGEDETSIYFAIGHLKYRPLSAPSADFLVGTWTTAGSRYVFHEDGTFEMGQVSVEAYAGASHRGRWTLDGYLLMLEPTDGGGWVTTVSAMAGRFLIIGQVLHSRG